MRTSAHANSSHVKMAVNVRATMEVSDAFAHNNAKKDA